MKLFVMTNCLNETHQIGDSWKLKEISNFALRLIKVEIFRFIQIKNHSQINQ